MICRSFIRYMNVCVLVGFILSIMPGLIVPTAAVSPPRGAFGFTDSSGSNILAWVYPGVNDTIYRSGSDTRLRSYYISRDPGAHQIACRFALSPVRQWVNWVEVWLDAGQTCSQEQWDSIATIGLGLCADSSGFPGDLLLDPVQYSPGQMGVPASGGYLRVALDYPAPLSPPDTLWVLIEWPADYPDLVLVGADDQPAAFNAMYHVAGQEEPRWNTWVLRNFMVRLNTSRYDPDCISKPDLGRLESGLIVDSAIQKNFIVARTERFDKLPGVHDSLFSVLPGGQICHSDTAVFAECTYDYAIRAVEDIDTSAASIVSIEVKSPFCCDWNIPQTPIFTGDENITLVHTLHNLDQTRLGVSSLAAWMNPNLPEQTDASLTYHGDSIPLYAVPASATVEPTESVQIVLSPADLTLSEGTYTMNSSFLVSDTTGHQIKYAFSCLVQLSDPLGITTDRGLNRPEVPSISVFPNPTRGEFAIEFASTRGGGEAGFSVGSVNGSLVSEYSIHVYDILGREVAGFDRPITNQGTDRYRVLFDGCDKSGNQLPSALYFIRVEGKGWSKCRKLIVLH